MTRRPLPRARVVAWSTLALFLGVLALLVFQLRSGRDPALGAAAAQTQVSVPPPRVLVRKLIVTRVVVHLPAEEEDDRPIPATTAPRLTTAPPRSVSVPAAAAPAPAPAPLTTRSS